MGISDDIHLGLCLGVVLAVRYFMKNPVFGADGMKWTPYLLCFFVGVPLIGYGKPLSHYFTVFVAGFTAFYSLMKAEAIWWTVYDYARHHVHTIYDLLMYRGSLGNQFLEALPAPVRNFLRDKLLTPDVPYDQGMGGMPPYQYGMAPSPPMGGGPDAEFRPAMGSAEPPGLPVSLAEG